MFDIQTGHCCCQCCCYCRCRCTHVSERNEKYAVTMITIRHIRDDVFVVDSGGILWICSACLWRHPGPVKRIQWKNQIQPKANWLQCRIQWNNPEKMCYLIGRYGDAFSEINDAYCVIDVKFVVPENEHWIKVNVEERFGERSSSNKGHLSNQRSSQ